MKAKVVEARANFDQLVADAFYEYRQKNPTGTVQDFYREKDKDGKDGAYKTLFKEYDDHMSGLYSHYFGSSKQKPVTSPESQVVKPQNVPTPAARQPNANTPQNMGPLEKRLRESKKAGS
jgi:hypothetical protein